MSQLQHYDTAQPHVHYVSGQQPTVTWQRRQGPFPRRLRVSALLFVIALITVMVAPFA